MLAPNKGNGFPWGNPSEATLPSAAASPNGLAPLPAPLLQPFGLLGGSRARGSSSRLLFFFFLLP